jgi:hypothetical protein
VPPLDPAQVVGRGMGLAQAYQQTQLGQMKLAEAEREDFERQNLGAAVRGTMRTDPQTGQQTPNLPGALSRAYQTSRDPLSLLKVETAYKKSQAETGKSALEARKTELETLQKQTEYVSGLANGVLAVEAQGGDVQQAYQAAIQQAAQVLGPDQIRGLPPTYDRSVVTRFAAQGQKYTEALQAQNQTISTQLRELELAETQKRTRVQEAKETREAAKPAYGFGNELDAAIYAVHGGAIGPGGTPTPAQVADGRRLLQEGKFEIAAGTGSSQIVQTPDGYARVNPRTGAVEMVTGPGGTSLQPKPTTEESRASSYATGARQAHDQATALERKGISTTTGTQLAQKLPFNLGNYLLPAEQQQYQQTILQFAQNLLRKESGAAISQSEYEMTNKTYFPQPGDGPEVIKQKQEARKAVVERIEREGARDTPRRAPAGGARQKPLPTTVEEIDRELADIERQLGGR